MFLILIRSVIKLTNSISILYVFTIFCLLIGGLLQFAYVGGWHYFWEQADRFQTLIVGSLIFISAGVAIYNSRAHIKAQDKLAKSDRYIRRKNIAGSASALTFTVGRILRTNCGVLQQHLGSPLEQVIFNAYEIILPDVKVLHSEQAREFIRLFEYMRSRNDGIIKLNEEIQKNFYEFLKETPSANADQVHAYINTIPYLSIPTYIAMMNSLSVAFVNLTKWLEDYSDGGKKFSREDYY